MSGQSVDPRLVFLSVHELPSLGHGRDGVVHAEAAVLKKVGKQTRLLGAKRSCFMLASAALGSTALNQWVPGSSPELPTTQSSET